jgi:hypothetical protein
MDCSSAWVAGGQENVIQWLHDVLSGKVFITKVNEPLMRRKSMLDEGNELSPGSRYRYSTPIIQGVTGWRRCDRRMSPCAVLGWREKQTTS